MNELLSYPEALIFCSVGLACAAGIIWHVISKRP